MDHIIKNINNATFIFSRFKQMQTASFGVFLKVGSRYESQETSGVAHFLEHLLFKGSKKYSYQAIKQEIEGRGGALNGFTSHEITAYYAHFLQKNLEISLDILLDMVLEPRLKDCDVAKERNVVLQEIKMYNDLPSARVGMLIDELIWPGHALGREVIGFSQVVSKITQSQIKDFQKKYYTPSSMVISCCGDFDFDEVCLMIDRRLNKTKLTKDVRLTAPKPLVGQKVKIEKKDLEQSHLCLGFRGLSYRDKDRVAIALLNVILGANMSSRLFEQIREKKALCYDISTETRKYKDSGAFIAQIGLDTEKIEIALQEILKELKKIKIKLVGGKELERAKDYLFGQMVMNLERPQGKMFYLAENLINIGTIFTIEDIKRQISEVTAHQIQDLANKVFDFNNSRVSCVGKVNDQAKQRLENILSEF